MTRVRVEMSNNFFFWPHHTICGILAPQPGMDPCRGSTELYLPNHWEGPKTQFFEVTNHAGSLSEMI